MSKVSNLFAVLVRVHLMFSRNLTNNNEYIIMNHIVNLFDKSALF